MSRGIRLLGILFCIVSIGYGCSSSDRGVEEATSNSESSGNLTLEKVLSIQGLTLINRIEVNGDAGYLAEYPDKFTEGENDEREQVVPVTKKCMILTGAAYNIGYQSASLMHKEAYPMLTDYMRKVGIRQITRLGINLPQDGETAEKAYKILYDVMVVLAKLVEKDIPQNLRDEMQGFADGMNDAGYNDIDYYRVLVLNQAIDGTFYMLGAALGYVEQTDKNKAAIMKSREAFVKLLLLAGIKNPRIQDMITSFELPLFGCNEIAVSGNATATGETFHGRDFMFDTANIYQDSACMAVYLPDKGYPFVTVTVPGFIGQSMVMNSEGLSMGQDVCMVGVVGETPGLSSMLVNRIVAQSCKNIGEAIEKVRNTSRGVPWIYFIVDNDTDPVYGNAVELETVTNQKKIKGPDFLPWWEQLLFSKYINMLDDDDMLSGGYIDKGVMVRPINYKYPANFVDSSLTRLDVKKLDVYKSAYKSGINFPPQNENDDNFIATANHFTIPRMFMLHYDPIIYLAYSQGPLPDSIWRYDNQVKLLKKYNGAIEYFGDGDYPEEGSAGWIIDFLNTGRDYPWYYRDKDKDGKLEMSADCTVEGHHAVINNDRREIKALFGYMDDPWVGVKLMPFKQWYYGASS